MFRSLQDGEHKAVRLDRLSQMAVHADCGVSLFALFGLLHRHRDVRDVFWLRKVQVADVPRGLEAAHHRQRQGG